MFILHFPSLLLLRCSVFFTIFELASSTLHPSSQHLACNYKPLEGQVLLAVTVAQQPRPLPHLRLDTIHARKNNGGLLAKRPEEYPPKRPKRHSLPFGTTHTHNAQLQGRTKRRLRPRAALPCAFLKTLTPDRANPSSKKVLKATLAKVPNLDPSVIEDICIGTVLSELGGSKAGRMASLAAGLPETSAFHTMNRACASSLSAVSTIAHAIAAGSINVGIAGGMESMTRNYGSKAIPTAIWPALRDTEDKNARDCIMSMGLTAENVAKRNGVSRADQDAFAAASQQKAAAAQAAGHFDAEVIPVPVLSTDPKNPDAQPTQVTVTKDDGVRAGTTVEKLAAMKPAFAADGTATAGNSSQISDGAAALLLARRSTAHALGLQGSIMGKWAGSVVAGCRPDEMGIGPAVAVPKLLSLLEMQTDEVDLWELNEAFAAQSVYCMRALGLDESKVNPKGGAIALGHPLGATGARLITGLLHDLRRLDKDVGVATLCIGTGMGQATLVVRE